MKKEIIFENKALYRDNFRVTGFRFGEGKKSACIVGSIRGNEVQQLYTCSQLVQALKELEKVTEEAANIEEYDKQALFYHDDVVPAMTALRAPVDRLEMIVDKEMWPMPSYGDLLFEV